ncbi:hypothetical protein HX890_23555 [Pseudomonas gingeri]|uniref:hypothetical protein n=1 Tax=Pseudomonas gingeri TaxID=117681 RepID=UPI0015A369BC|nr:hypothetical protein [Pseudomonas gingeri]NWD77100.1 hypothetical protein [Pseudomonas gingeri]
MAHKSRPTSPPHSINLSTSRGFIKAANSQISASLEKPRIFWNFLINEYEFIEVRPWGINIPLEVTTYSSLVNVQVNIHGFPPTTQISTQWQTADHRIVFKSAPVPITWPAPHQRIAIPHDQLARFENQTVQVSYYLHQMDDLPVESEATVVNINAMLLGTFPIIEGVTNSQLKVADYPNGVPVTVDTIEHIKSYSKVVNQWSTYRVVGSEIIYLYFQSQTRQATPGMPYQFQFPPEAYTGYPEGARSICNTDITLVPEGQAFPAFGIGGLDFKLI